MDELDAQALREAIRTSAKAANIVNAMVGDRLSCVRDPSIREPEGTRDGKFADAMSHCNHCSPVY
eukprot:4230053-Amphidinium_carterae.1